MERSQEHLAEFVPLANAAALLYVQVMGKPLQPGNVAQMNELLERAAAALSSVAAIYSRDSACAAPTPLHPPGRHALGDRHPQARRIQVPSIIRA